MERTLQDRDAERDKCECIHLDKPGYVVITSNPQISKSLCLKWQILLLLLLFLLT